MNANQTLQPGIAPNMDIILEPSGCSTTPDAKGLVIDLKVSDESLVKLANSGKPHVDRQTGEVFEYNKTAARLRRYMSQAGVRKLMPKTSTAKCLVAPAKGAKHITVYKSLKHGEAHYGNLQTCSSVWACPCCAAKISERRREELSKAINQASTDGSVSLVTLTFSHKRNDQLKRIKNGLTKAYSSMQQQRAYKNLLAEYGIYGTVRAFEITWSEANGWHPHFHILWFSENALGDQEHQDIKERLFTLWRKAATKFSLGAPSKERGVDVRGGDYAACYGAKWGLEQEMTKGHIKQAKGESFTPFDLIYMYAKYDCKRSGALFVEYAETFKGARQLVWSQGLKQRFEIDAISDEELAEEQDEEAMLLGRLTLEDWKMIVRQERRGELLVIATNGGWPAVERYLETLRHLQKSGRNDARRA